MNESGFTFISVVTAITIMFIMMPLLMYLLQFTSPSSNYEELSIQQFMYFLRDEFISASDYTLEKSAVHLNVNNDIVIFEQYGNIVRRRVNNLGHEVYLRDIKNMHFSPLMYGVRVEIISLEGDIYEKDIIYYH